MTQPNGMPPLPVTGALVHPKVAAYAAAGGIGTPALVGTVIWQTVTQIWPDFTPTPEQVLLTAAAMSGIGTLIGAYLPRLKNA